MKRRRRRRRKRRRREKGGKDQVIVGVMIIEKNEGIKRLRTSQRASEEMAW